MAVPNPEPELARLRASLQKGLSPVLLVTGAAGHFRGEAMDAIVAALPQDADVRSISGDEDSDGRELLDLRGGSLFGRGCYVVVRRGEGWLKRHGAALVEHLAAIKPGYGLIVEAAKLDRRTKVGKALVERAAVFEFRPLYTEPYDKSRSPLEAEMVGWIVQRGRAQGVTLAPEAALLVMATAGTEPAEVLAELGRLRVAFGDRKTPLSPDDLRGQLSGGFESNPFELAEAVLDFDRRRAERSLSAMFDRGVRGREGDTIDRGGLFPFITSWLWQSLAKAYEGRFLLDRGTPAKDVARRLGVRVFADRFERQVHGNPASRLERGLLLLHEAQRELRRTGEDPEWILRTFLQRYFGEVAVLAVQAGAAW